MRFHCDLFLLSVLFMVTACARSLWIRPLQPSHVPSVLLGGACRSLCREKPADEALFYVLACFAREGPYLEEWVTYYLKLGFDRITLLDMNRGEDDVEFIRRIASSCVTIVDKRKFGFSMDKQAVLYSEFYRTLRPIDWCLFVDIDEFLTLETMSLRQYLTRAEEARCDVIKINWMAYGNNGKIRREPGGVLQRFPEPVRPLDFKIGRFVWNGLIKTLARGGLRARFRGVHTLAGVNFRPCNGRLDQALYDEYFSVPPTFEVAHIKHFFSKSQVEYEEKVFLKWNGTTREEGFYNWKFYDLMNRHPPNVPYVYLCGDNRRPCIRANAS